MWIVNLVLTLALALTLGAPRASTQRAERFDAVVRADFFAGLAGDAARLAKAMEACERALADNPKHAEALVWHGAGLMYLAGQAFAAGDTARGASQWERALAEMNGAVALEPDNLAVLIPRGAVLLQATRHTSPEIGRPLLEQGVRDYERALARQEPYFDTLGDHPKSELLFGLAEGSARLGRTARAQEYFRRLVEQVPRSGHVAAAQAFLRTGQLPKVTGTGCVGCHTR